VESFQILYALDTDDDSLPNQFLRASEIDALDAALVPAPSTTLELNQRTNWKRVVAVRVALLVRGSRRARDDQLNMRYDLFGADYASASAANDIGTSITEATLPAATRNRLRKVFSVTIQLRNQPRGSGV
jgi:type IV pilus assembly protein PilW